MWEEARSFHALSGHITLPASLRVHQPRSSLKLLEPLVQGFQGSFITLAYKPLVMKSLFSPPLLPGRQGVGLKVSTLQSLGWFPWHPVPILRGFPKNHLIDINSGVVERGLL